VSYNSFTIPKGFGYDGLYYIGNINMVIYMYDLTSKLSYKNLDYWEKYVYKHYGNIDSFRIGNKSDLNVVVILINRCMICEQKNKKTFVALTIYCVNFFCVV
jgi:hypothetical protein